jgi:hypothetical protein
MRKLFVKTLLLALTGFGFVACIDNDIPYPRLDCSLVSISVDGLKGYETKTEGDTTFVTLDIDESVDLREVAFGSINVTNHDKAKIIYARGADVVEGDKWNLREGVTLCAEIYGYHNLFHIVGVQTIEKRFRVEGQMGEAYFEEHTAGSFENRIALINVPAGTDFSAINVLELKLGPEGETTYTPEIEGITDFTSVGGDDHIKVVKVAYRDVEQTWRIIVQEGSTAITKVNAWAKSVDIEAMGTPGEEHAIEYRAKGSDSWQKATLATDAEGVFSATITGLTPETEYECRAVSGSEMTDAQGFTTEAALMLENGDFEKWSKSGKALWLPYLENDPIIHTFTDPTHPGEVFNSRGWDTGNHGAITLGSSNSIPLSEARATGLTDCLPYEGEDAAFLQSKFVGIGVAGKLAGGNIFTGTFGVVQGTNGTTYLGIPFTSRPKRLVGYYKYTPKPIDNVIKYDGVDGTFITEEWRGKSDTMNMVVALGNWEIPHEVRTDRRNRSEFTPKTPGLVAWGSLASAEEKSEWTRFEIPLEFFDDSTAPRYLVIMMTASKWCDFFTGAVGSTLIVDGLQLEYE